MIGTAEAGTLLLAKENEEICFPPEADRVTAGAIANSTGVDQLPIRSDLSEEIAIVAGTATLEQEIMMSGCVMPLLDAASAGSLELAVPVRYPRLVFSKLCLRGHPSQISRQVDGLQQS